VCQLKYDGFSSSLVRYHDTGGGFIFEKIMKPFVITIIGGTAYADTRNMEMLVMEIDLDSTILRPSGLFATPAMTDYCVAEEFRGRYTSRKNLADCLLKQLTNDQYLRKTVIIATVSGQPMMQFIVKEVFQRRPAV
jgi:hypothetical protein